MLMNFFGDLLNLNHMVSAIIKHYEDESFVEILMVSGAVFQSPFMSYVKAEKLLNEISEKIGEKK